MKSFEIIETPFGNYIINQYDMISNCIQKQDIGNIIYLSF